MCIQLRFTHAARNVCRNRYIGYWMLVRVGEKEEMFYLTTHSTHFIYGYMASDIWLRTILIVRKETRCRHIGYSFRLAARVFLYAPSHIQDSTYHGLCYTSRGALTGEREVDVDKQTGRETDTQTYTYFVNVSPCVRQIKTYYNT